MIRKLQKKFVAAAMLSLLAVLIVLIALINVLNYRNLVSEADSTLELLEENGGGFPDSWNPPEDKHRPEDRNRSRRNFSAELPFQSRFFTVTLRAETGETVETNLKNIAAIDEETAVQMAQDVAERNRDRGFMDSYRYGKKETSFGTQWIFLNCERELSTFWNFVLVSCVISLAGFSAVFLLTVLVSGRVVQPIAQSYEKQKRFITDAGHELKTPLTIIRADADVLDEDLPDNEWLDDIRLQTDRLAALTNDLIYLSRMEEQEQPQMLPIPLSEIVQETAQSFFAVAKTQGKDFSLKVQPLLSLNGDEKAIRKLVSILLDNALKYSDSNGSISLSLQKNGKQIRLSVANTTEQIQKGNADRLFDRFYRTDSSRNSETGGFGLGLSVAKAVVESHKGKIRAFSSDGKSLTVEAVFNE